MLKTAIHAFTLTLFSLLFLGLVQETYAQGLPTCFIRTDPAKLFTDTTQTPKAKFFANLSVLGSTKAYPQWKMQFICGIRNNISVAKIEDDREVSREMESGATACEFSAGTHDVLIYAVTTAGEVPQCKGSYKVEDSASLCTIKLNQEQNLTSQTNLSVSGSNLASNGKYGLFIDDIVIKGKTLNFLDNPSFSDIKIPNEYLTPGEHTANLRYIKFLNMFDPSGEFNASDYGPPLCVVKFTIGTPGKTGAIVQSGTGRAGKSIDPLAKAAGQQCGTTENPAIVTAIGCIHTNPAGFVKDLMTFIVAISGGLAFLMMLLGAFQMLSSQGNPDALNAGRERLTSAVIGLLFVIFATFLLQIIGVDILKLPGFGR